MSVGWGGGVGGKEGAAPWLHPHGRGVAHAPVSLLALRYRMVRDGPIVQSDSGMVPRRLLRPRSRCSRLVKLLRHAGIVPEGGGGWVWGERRAAGGGRECGLGSLHVGGGDESGACPCTDRRGQGVVLRLSVCARRACVVL